MLASGLSPENKGRPTFVHGHLKGPRIARTLLEPQDPV